VVQKAPFVGWLQKCTTWGVLILCLDRKEERNLLKTFMHTRAQFSRCAPPHRFVSNEAENVAFKIITGTPPFPDLADAQVMFAVLNGRRPERPGDVWCPDYVWDLVQKCWDKDPLKRPHAHVVHSFLRSPLTRSGAKINETHLANRWKTLFGKRIPSCTSGDWVID
jgi:hypothetical protein